MDQVIKGATAKVRRQIAVSGDRCLEEHEEPFHFATSFLQVKAWSDRGECLTWGVLDSAIDGLRQCAYEKGKYNLMSCVIDYAWRGEVGFVSLKRLRQASGDELLVSRV